MNPFFGRDPAAPRYALVPELDGTVAMIRDGTPMWAKWKRDGSGEIEFSPGATETWKDLAKQVRGPTLRNAHVNGATILPLTPGHKIGPEVEK